MGQPEPGVKKRGADSAKYVAGMKVRREVFGDAHVDRSLREQTAFDAAFQRFITETAWGTVWAGTALDRRTRSLITIAILASLDRAELELHLRASRNTGATLAEIAEVLMHVAIYAGIPAANSAFARAKTVNLELAAARAATAAKRKPRAR